MDVVCTKIMRDCMWYYYTATSVSSIIVITKQRKICQKKQKTNYDTTNHSKQNFRDKRTKSDARF